jgi:nucleoside 2-deoxyribosyltransferase
MRIYVASGLDNASKPEFQKLLQDIRDLGHALTYEWWTHGSMKDHSDQQICLTAERELYGIETADLVIVWLPGGGGTHVEMGYAFGLMIPVLLMNFDPATMRKVAFYYLFSKVTWWDDWVNTGSSDALAYNISRAMEKA